MTNPTYANPVMPPELRVSDVGWKHFLDTWDNSQLFLIKQIFLQYGLAYSEFRPYIANLENQTLKLELSRKVISDMLCYPGRDTHENIEGERRLLEARERLTFLMEKLPETELSIAHQAIMRNSLRYPPATESQIQAAEARLGLRFPPSYREFLSISNGWLIEQQPPLLPVENVAYLRELDPEYVRLWLEEDYMYQSCEVLMTPEPLGEGGHFANNLVDIPTACLKNAVAIGVDWIEKAFLLLDPTTVDEHGEWRAFWLFRYEGPIVTNSFARLMEFMYRRNTER